MENGWKNQNQAKEHQQSSANSNGNHVEIAIRTQHHNAYIHRHDPHI